MVCALWMSWLLKNEEKQWKNSTFYFLARGIYQQSHRHGRDMDFYLICYFIKKKLLLYYLMMSICC